MSIKGRYEAGLKAFGKTPPSPSQDRMLRAIAAIVDWKPSKAKAKDKPTLPLSPKEVYETIRDTVGSKVACEPYNSRWFPVLGRRMQETQGLEKADLQRLVRWIEQGGIDFMGECTFSHVIKHWDNWIAKARSWDREGHDMVSSVEDWI